MDRSLAPQLALFAEVARRGGFRAAARRLALSPSAVSQGVAALEAALDTRLFNRSTRSVALTEAGRRLLAKVGPALDEIDVALREAHDADAAPSGAVRITTTHLPAVQLFAPHLGAFADAYPAIALDLVLEDRFVDMVAEGFDLGVRMGEMLRPDMIATKIGPPLRLAIVASPDYLARHGTPATLQELAGHRCLHRRLANRVYRWEVVRDGAEVTLDALPHSLVANDDAVLLRAALDGAGIAFMIETLVADDLAAGRLVELFAANCPPFPGFFLYHVDRRQMRPAVRATIDFFVAANRAAG